MKVETCTSLESAAAYVRKLNILLGHAKGADAAFRLTGSELYHCACANELRRLVSLVNRAITCGYRVSFMSYSYFGGACTLETVFPFMEYCGIIESGGVTWIRYSPKKRSTSPTHRLNVLDALRIEVSLSKKT